MNQTWRYLLVPIAALLGLLALLVAPVPADAAQTVPTRQTLTYTYPSCFLIGTVTLSVTAPTSVAQGETFALEDVTLTFDSIPQVFLSGPFTFDIERPANAAGNDLVLDYFTGGIGPNFPDPPYGPDPVGGPFTQSYAVWGDVGDTMDFYPGALSGDRFFFNGVGPTPLTCDPPAGTAPLVSILIDPPLGGGPITDEVSVLVVDGTGSVVYQHRSFVLDGGFRFNRDANGFVTSMFGIASWQTPAGTALVQLVSAAPNATSPGTGALFALVDPAAELEIGGTSLLAHITSGNHETVAGFALGTMDGEPVGIYWSVRDLA